MNATPTRQPNGYAGYCMDCRVEVPAGEGGLYRYTGAARNLLHLKRNRSSPYTFMVRCAACTEKHDYPKGRPVVDEAAVSYQPVATIGNSQCGN